MGVYTLYDASGKQVSLTSNENFYVQHDKSNDAQAEADYNAKSAKHLTAIPCFVFQKIDIFKIKHSSLSSLTQPAFYVFSPIKHQTINENRINSVLIIGGDGGSCLDLFALNVSSLKVLNKNSFQDFKASHSAHKSPNPKNRFSSITIKPIMRTR